VSDIEPAALTWIDRFAAELGVESPSRSDVEALLALAAHAAHASHRQAAPVACWLAATAGCSPSEALARATTMT
jgi:Domain of unknown function (DUF6457)